MLRTAIEGLSLVGEPLEGPKRTLMMNDDIGFQGEDVDGDHIDKKYAEN